MNLKQCFEVLKLSPDASHEEIQKAYKSLSKIWHPNRFSGDIQMQSKVKDKFVEIQLAYKQINAHLSREKVMETDLSEENRWKEKVKTKAKKEAEIVYRKVLTAAMKPGAAPEEKARAKQMAKAKAKAMYDKVHRAGMKKIQELQRQRNESAPDEDDDELLSGLMEIKKTPEQTLFSGEDILDEKENQNVSPQSISRPPVQAVPYIVVEPTKEDKTGRNIFTDFVVAFFIVAAMFAYSQRGCIGKKYEEMTQKTEIKSPPQKTTRDQILVHQGKILFERGKYEMAIDKLNQAVEINPDNDEAYFQRGLAWMYKGSLERAKDDFTRALVTNPQNSVAFANRGTVWFDLGDYDKAVEDFSRSLELNPENTVTLINRGNAYYKRRDYDLSLWDFNRALELDPQSYRAYLGRGNTFYQQEEIEKALDDYTMALRINPANYEAYYNRGNIYFDREEYRLAIVDYETAISLNPNFTPAQTQLALARGQLEN